MHLLVQVFSTEQSFIIQDPSLEQFTEQTPISLTDVQYSDAAWGDYDNDGDLDIVLTGSNSINPRAYLKFLEIMVIIHLRNKHLFH